MGMIRTHIPIGDALRRRDRAMVVRFAGRSVTLPPGAIPAKLVEQCRRAQGLLDG